MKNIMLLIVKHLRDQVKSGKLTPDATEGIEVAIQCIQEAFQISEAEIQACNESLQDIYSRHKTQPGPRVVTNEQREEAENLKQVGNSLMKENNFKEAITNYTQAIEIDPNNAVYYCNRAAAHIKLGAYGSAIEDCHQALRIDPRYSKAHSRLGFAYSATGNNIQAKSCYQKALELEPGNESYQTCLQEIEAHLSNSGSALFSELANLLPFVDLPGLLHNPSFVNMMSDPMVQRLVDGAFAQQGISPLGNLVSLGQQITERLQQGAARNVAQNTSSRQAEGSNGFPDLIRPQDGDAVPASQGQSADPQQQEVKPDVVQQIVGDHPEGNLPDNRNLGSLGLSSPASVPKGDGSHQSDANAGNS